MSAAIPTISSEHIPVLETPSSIDINDVDQDDLLSSRNPYCDGRDMDVKEIGLDNVREVISFLPDIDLGNVAKGEHGTRPSSLSAHRSMLLQEDINSPPCTFQTFLPERGGKWCTEQPWLEGRPQEYPPARRFDPVEAIKGLWGEPSFVNHLVCGLTMTFQEAEDQRIYSEMWTGGFLNALQVCFAVCSSPVKS